MRYARQIGLTITGVFLLVGFCLFASAKAQPESSCKPSGGLSFICGAMHPEDLLPIPGTSFFIASGFAPGAGLKLVDTTDLHLVRWYQGTADQVDPDRTRFPACPGAPDAAAFEPHGIALRDLGGGHDELLAVNHGGRESIEIFSVDATGAVPKLSWKGCVMSPMPSTNSVAEFADGTILLTILTRPGTALADFVEGKRTGGVWAWKPGDKAFHFLPGTDLPGDNGLEIDPDQKHFYVVAFGWHAVVVFDRAHTKKPLRVAVAPGFMPDNVHWIGGQLIAAGMTSDEPACGGVRKVVNGKADTMQCHRGYGVAELNPKTGAWRMVAYGEPNPAFNGVSSAMPLGDTLWLGSYQADRIAYRPLPGVK